MERTGRWDWNWELGNGKCKTGKWRRWDVEKEMASGMWNWRGRAGHGVQTSTEHLGHVGAEGDEKYVTG